MADPTPQQPPGIDENTLDLPNRADALTRVMAFLCWYGDGRVGGEVLDDGPPLYARDIEALTRAETQ